MNKALAEAAIRDSFLQSAQEPVGGSAEQFCGSSARILPNTSVWRRI